jgi:hypothetical protein
MTRGAFRARRSGRLAQLVRAPALQAGSRGFESLTAHQPSPAPQASARQAIFACFAGFGAAGQLRQLRRLRLGRPSSPAPQASARQAIFACFAGFGSAGQPHLRRGVRLGRPSLPASQASARAPLKMFAVPLHAKSLAPVRLGSGRVRKSDRESRPAWLRVRGWPRRNRE